MADGGLSIDHSEVIELAARRLVNAFGTGQAWYGNVQVAGNLLADEELSQSDRLAIAKRGRVLEKAAHSIDGSRHVRRKLAWRRTAGVVTVVQCKPDLDVLAALSFAKLDGPLEAILLLYATGDVPRYWPTVKRFGLAVKAVKFAEEALTDAMQRILCGQAQMSKDKRAKALKIRVTKYRDLTNQCECLLDKWLYTAARRFMSAIA